MTDVHKNKIALKFFNRVLDELDMDEIDELTEFKNVDRKLLVKPGIREIIDEMHSEISKKVVEMKMTYYRRNSVKEFNLVYIRGLCTALGKRISIKTKKIVKKRVLTLQYYYSIIDNDEK
jgi:hypothetical protein